MAGAASLANSAPRRRSYLFALLRGVVAAEFLLLSTWNPTGYSYFAWVNNTPELTAPKVFVGVCLLTAYVAWLRIAFVALGPLGVLASLVTIGSLLLAGSTLGLLRVSVLIDSPYFWIFVIACILAVGIVWGKIQQRMSGERSVLKSPP